MEDDTATLQKETQKDDNDSNNDDDDDDGDETNKEESLPPSLTYFETLAGNVVNCLIKSDLKRKNGGDGGSTGWTSWVDDAASFQLKCCIDALALSIPDNPSDMSDMDIADQLQDRDEAMKWIRWLKSSPSPLMIELSNELQTTANQYIHTKDLQYIETTREDLLQRMGLRLITLPSGSSLTEPIRTPAGAMAFGKLIYGGCNRYRILPGKYQRRTGERETVKVNMEDNIACWMQFGGPERNYEGLDIGPCAILEVIILPQGLKLRHAFKEDGDGGIGGSSGGQQQAENHMTMAQIGWKPDKMFQFYDDMMKKKKNRKNIEMRNNNNDMNNNGDGGDKDELLTLTGKERNDFLEDSFTDAVGGLRPQISSIVRRVLDGRVFRSYHDENSFGGGENGEKEEIVGEQSLLDAIELESLGLNPVRGLLLYGPPGCGKTALAREISKALRARKPKIIAAPELLDRWVGGSEKLVRSLFTDAEQELNYCGGDTTKSSLHVIVIDEIDAVFRKRSASEDSASTTRASAVNQILAKLDGVTTLSNVLLIGMTNRRDLLDEALLRPGRLEVQVEIPLPNREGRREIFQIHFEALRRKGRLSDPLCRAIDGPKANNGRVESDLQTSSLRSIIRQSIVPNFSTKVLSNRLAIDLSSDRLTKGFSGADIQGLVRCSGSIALARARQQGMGIEGLLITLEDVKQALEEVKG